MYNSMKLIEMAGSWNDLTKFKGPVSYRSCFKSSCLKVDPTLPILVPWICLESHPHLSIFADLCVSVQYKPVSEIEDTIEQDNTGCVCWPYAWKPNVTHLARFYTITQSAIKAVGWHGTANPRQNCPELQKVHQVLQPLEQGWTLVLLFQLKQNWMQNGKAWERDEKGWKEWKGMERDGNYVGIEVHNGVCHDEKCHDRFHKKKRMPWTWPQMNFRVETCQDPIHTWPEVCQAGIVLYPSLLSFKHQTFRVWFYFTSLCLTSQVLSLYMFLCSCSTVSTGKL